VYKRQTEMKGVVSVDIPIKQNGEFDMERQKVIADKYERIEATKNQILELVRPLIETDIEF